MPVRGPGPYQLRVLSKNLREASDGGMRRELFKAITEAARPLAADVKDPAHLRSYMPNRYAEVLASDLSVSTLQRSSGSQVGVRIQAKGRRHGRKVVQLDEGIIHHPLFGRREHWYLQLRGMRSGFFSDPARKSGSEVRDAILAAMRRTAAKIEGR